MTSAAGMGSKDKPNDAVKKMQQQLIDAGYELPKFGADGIFRGETQRALARFQRDNKLKDQKGIAAGKETNPVLAKVAAEKKAKTAEVPAEAPAVTSSLSPIPGGMDDVAQKMGLKGAYNGNGEWKDESGKTTHKWSNGTWKPVEASASVDTPAAAPAAADGQPKTDTRSASQIQIDNAAKVENEQVEAFLKAHPGVTYNKANGQFKDEKGQHLGSWNPSTNPATNQIYGIDISARKDFKTTVPGVHTGVETPAEPAAASTSNNRSVSGTLLRGKADGAITYNGKTINPGDPSYAEAEQALIDTKKTQDAARAASELQAAQDETARWKSSFKPTHIAPNRFTRGGTELRQNAGGEWIDKDGNRWEKPFLGRDPEAIPPPSGSSPVIPRAVPPGQQSSLDTPSNSVAGLTKDESDAMVRQSTLAESRVSLSSVVDELLNEDWKETVKKAASDSADTTSDWLRGLNKTISGGQWPKVAAGIQSVLPGSGNYQQELEKELARDAAAEKRSPRAFSAVANTLRNPLQTADDAVRAGVNTLTFGATDKAEALANTLGRKVSGSNLSWEDELASQQDQSTIRSADAEKRSPAASTVGSIAGNAGGIASGVGAAKLTAQALKQTPRIVRALGVGTAALGGQMYGDQKAGELMYDLDPDNYHTAKYAEKEAPAPSALQKTKEDMARITTLAGLRK